MATNKYSIAEDDKRGAGFFVIKDYKIAWVNGFYENI